MAFSIGIPQQVTQQLGKAKQFTQDNPLLVTGVGAGAVGVVAIGGAAAVRGRKKATKRRKSNTRRSRTRRTLTKRQKQVRRIRKRPGRQSPYTAGARKDRSRTRVRYTKNGQPYNLSGKGGRAKFITKKSAKARRKR